MNVRLPLRFSLRTLLVATVACALLLGVFARIHSRAERQRAILAAATELGGNVRYDFQCYSESKWYAPQRWLAPRVGPDLVGNVLILNFHMCSPTQWREVLPAATQLHSITHFAACCDTLQPADVEQLSRFRGLRELHFHYCPKLPELTPLGTLAELRLLGLHSCRGLTTSKLQGLRAAPQLKLLDLCSTDAGDELTPLLAALPALEELHIEASEISAQGLSQLQPSKSLRLIHVDSTQAAGRTALGPQIKLSVK